MEFAAISFVFSLAIQLQVCLVALERVDVDNIVLHAPESIMWLVVRLAR